ncbi:Sugar ABC transporter permease YjfF [Klebsiella michiganensis]
MIKRNLPLMITLAVFVLGYLYCLTQFPGFASTRVICNILTDNAFLGIIAVGMTFVILSGGIDLSVGSVIAFTGVFLAKAIGFWGISPLVAFPLVLVMGCAFGAFMGLLIDALKIPAFIITLAGMFSCAASATWSRKSRYPLIIRYMTRCQDWHGPSPAADV